MLNLSNSPIAIEDAVISAAIGPPLFAPRTDPIRHMAVVKRKAIVKRDPAFTKKGKPRKSNAGRRGGTGDEFSAEKRRVFLEHYAKGGTVAMAARKTGVSSVTVFKHIRNDKVFAAAYNVAQNLNTDELEDLLRTLAMAGNVAAIFGTLKARRPEKWRDNFKVDHTNSDGSFKAFAVGLVQNTEATLRNVGSDETTH